MANTTANSGETLQDRDGYDGNQSPSDGAMGAFVGGMLVGAAAGAIAGLLATPHDGKETRKLLKQSADALPGLTRDVVTSVQFQSQRLVKSSFNGWEDSLLRLRNAISTGIAVSQQERQRLAQVNQSSSSPSNPPNTNAKS